jgi:hypothetical protein
MTKIFKNLIDYDYKNINSYSITRLKTLIKKYKKLNFGLSKHIYNYKDKDGNIIFVFTNEEYDAIIKERNNRYIDEYGDVNDETGIKKMMLNDIYDEYYQYIQDKFNDAKYRLEQKEKDNKNNCECGVEVIQKHMNRHLLSKQHFDFTNGIKYVEKPKIYNCDCGSNDILFIQKKRHETSKKHIDWKNGIEPIEKSKYYECVICQVQQLKSNKWKHEQTKYHKDKIILCVEL